jgi:hypothetical protein
MKLKFEEEFRKKESEMNRLIATKLKNGQEQLEKEKEIIQLERENLLKIIDSDPDKKIVYDLQEKVKELDKIKSKMYTEIILLRKKVDL